MTGVKTLTVCGLPVTFSRFRRWWSFYYATDRVKPVALQVIYSKADKRRKYVATVWGVNRLPDEFRREFIKEVGEILHVLPV